MEALLTVTIFHDECHKHSRREGLGEMSQTLHEALAKLNILYCRPSLDGENFMRNCRYMAREARLLSVSIKARSLSIIRLVVTAMQCIHALHGTCTYKMCNTHPTLYMYTYIQVAVVCSLNAHYAIRLYSHGEYYDRETGEERHRRL